MDGRLERFVKTVAYKLLLWKDPYLLIPVALLRVFFVIMPYLAHTYASQDNAHNCDLQT